MTARSAPLQQRRPGRHRGAVVLFAVCATLACCPSNAGAQSRDKYCVAGRPSVFLVVDVTTEYDERDRDLLLGAVQQIFSTLGGGERFIIRTVTESFSTSDRLFDGCVPVCAKGDGGGIFFGCSQGTVTVDKRNFLLNATAAMKTRLHQFRGGQRSDIIRTLVSIVREDGKNADRCTFYLFSDLIENSDHLSGSVLFRRSNKALMDHLRKNRLVPDFNGAVVKVFGVGRAGTPGRPPLAVDKLEKLRSFWSSYFEAAHVQTIEINEGLPRFN